jgi:methylamine dehydrogenase heavy chain
MRLGRISVALAAMLPTAVLATTVVPPPLAPEHIGIEKLPPRSAHWAYLLDVSWSNYIDERVYVYDGDAGRLLGMMDLGYYGNFAESPDGRTSALAATYWSRGGHGERTEVVEWYDNQTLKPRGELVLPAKRAQVGAITPFNLAYSDDGRYLYSTNLTPASSVSVIDVAKNATTSEIDTDGCVQAIPSAPHRFSAICENGRLLTVAVDEKGQESSRSISDAFFDVDKDPVFVQSVPTPVGATFVSFLGDIHGVDLTGQAVQFAPVWALVSAKERGRWRPGGQQILAYNAPLNRLYVLMHRGGEGSHKEAGSEIWVFDVGSHKRLARWPVAVAKHGGAVALLATRDSEPLLYVATDRSALLVLDARSGRVIHMEEKLGQSLWYMQNPS